MNIISLAKPEDLRLASRPRSLYSSKGDNGRVLIIGGSSRFHGAPALASNAAYLTLAALRVGIGYAITCVPKGIVSQVRKLSPNIIVIPLTGSDANPKDLKVLKKEASKADVLIIGPGLGRNKNSLKTIAKLIVYCLKLNKMALVDADAIYSLKLAHRELNKNIIITPNDSEFSHLYKGRLDRKDYIKRAKAARSVARRLNVSIVLKGHNTIVTDGTKVKIIKSKTSALATMGTGDVLSGIIGGYMAKNRNAFLSAVAGAYLHALIGDRLYKEKGYHIIAEDVVDCIPKILKQFNV